jgi:hypothetical protein
MPKKLKKSDKKKWVEALRSGAYIKSKGYLADPYTGGFCCLGVACAIGIATPYNDQNYAVNREFLPSDIQDRLISMNDIKSNSFNYIANWIEENL